VTDPGARARPPYDAVLLLSFGGPDGPDDVMPFLRTVTRGRGVPDERLEEVAEHYRHFGGVSPINALNRALQARLQERLNVDGPALPVYWGNRNWHPMVEDTVAEMAANGVRRALVVATSAYAGYSACAQYHEDIARARAAVGSGAPDLEKIRHFFDHPLFVAANADALLAARATLPADVSGAAWIVFTAHSVPVAMDAAAGPEGGLYGTQVRATARLVADRAGVAGWDVAWQSRSGPPRVSWLEPDILARIDALADAGAAAVVVCPTGFVSDHLEVRWDLDEEARRRAAERGLPMARASTAGSDPRFVDMLVELIRERTDRAPARRCSSVTGLGAGRNGERCAPHCCESGARSGVRSG
jgi:ferrochelatase